MMFNADFFREHQKTIRGLLNSPIGASIRRGLWIDDLRLPITKITPESYHLLLPNGKIRTVIHSDKQHAEAIHKNYSQIWERVHAWDMRFANRYLPAFNLGFDTYSEQPDETSGVDTKIISSTPTTNYATDATLSIGEVSTGASIQRTLIKFDLSSIPAANTPSSATQSFWTAGDFSSNARDYKLYRVLLAWTEAGANWNNYVGASAWNTAGCGNSTLDYDGANVWATTNFGSAIANNTQMDFVYSATGLTELKKFIDGTYTNNGWLGKADTETDDCYTLHSSSSGTAGFRPKLAIEHSEIISGSVVYFF